MKIRRVYTGHGDTTIRKTPWGIQFESESQPYNAKDVCKVEKKERTEEGYLLTLVGGSIEELSEEDYDEDDIKRVRKGCTIGIWTNIEKTGLCIGYSSDYIEKTLSEYFPEA